MRNCDLCAEIDLSLSNVENGKRIGVSETTIRRHRAHMVEESLPVQPLTVERMTVFDKTTGSWTKYKAIGPDVDLLDYSDIEKLFDVPVELPPTSGNPFTELLSMTDLQIGKACERMGGTPETIARARLSVAKFVDRIMDSKPETVVLADGGDIIENCFNTPRQRVTNDLDVPAQIRTARRLMAEAIRAVSMHAPRVIVVSVPSNHGEFRTDYGSPGGTTDADWGLEINHSLEEIFKDRPGFEHVEFVRTEPLDDTAVITVSNTKLAINHGYHSKGIHKHAEWWAKQDHGRRTGWDADILMMGHYHTFNVQHSGNARWIISVSSADPGSEWFSKMNGVHSLSGMTAFRLSDGMWSDIAIL